MFALLANEAAEGVVWHYWLAVPLAAGAILAVLTIIGLYFARVVKTRYPQGR